MMNSFVNVLTRSEGRTYGVRCLSTTFDGAMANCYMKFFNAAHNVWKHTDEIVAESTEAKNTSVET